MRLVSTSISAGRIESPFIGFSLTPMSFNLGSERKIGLLLINNRLTPTSFNLGSEQHHINETIPKRLTPMSFNLGSEPLFSNLYLIVT